MYGYYTRSIEVSITFLKKLLLIISNVNSFSFTIVSYSCSYFRATNTRFPGSYYDSNIEYLTVIGNSISGKQKENYHAFDDARMLFQQSPEMMEAIAYESYSMVCGNGNEAGDGVVPCNAGHLDGATQITLSGVQHTFSFPEGGDWYGSPTVIHSWHDIMLAQLHSKEVEEGKSFDTTDKNTMRP